MKRYTIHYRYGQDYVPMINCFDIKTVGEVLTSVNDDGLAFKVYDNRNKDWVDPESVFLACILSNPNQGVLENSQA